MALLPYYVKALKRGWSADTARGKVAAYEELERIASDPQDFLASLDDPEARGAPFRLFDGSWGERIPGFQRWLWDEGFCGVISLRWLREGTAQLPSHVLGHVGYAVVPWRQGRAYAAQGMRLLLPEARAYKLPWLEIATDPGNLASQKVILAVGGRLIETSQKPASRGGGDIQRWRIEL